MNPQNIPVVILCGGRGILVEGKSGRCNKALVPVAGEPMLMHVMRKYARAGFRTMALAAGWQHEALRAELIERYQARPNGDGYALTLDGATLQVSVVDTGLETRTWARVRRVEQALGAAERFCVTYSDIVSDVDPAEVLAFHLEKGAQATVVAAQLPCRFRVIGFRPGDSRVYGFAQRPVVEKDSIIGGYYVFERAILSINAGTGEPDRLTIEEDVLNALVRNGTLHGFPFRGFWQYLDSERDIAAIERGLAASN